MNTAPASDSASLAARVVGFIAHLRENGMQVGAGDAPAALQVLVQGRLSALHDNRERLKILLTGRKTEWERFDDLFEAYWLGAGRIKQRSARKSRSGHSTATTRLWADRQGTNAGPSTVMGQGEQTAADSAGDAPQATGIASAQHSIGRRDLRDLVDRDEIARAEQVAYDLARALRYRLSRRYRVSPNGRRVDLRKTIRRSLGCGGEPVRLVHRSRPDRPVRVLLMLDVSESMQAYSRYLLQFVKGLVGSWMEADAYLFNTRLTRVTDVLREKDAMLGMTRLSLMSGGFGGGTRIGECLQTFNDQHAKRALTSRSVFIMLSDGYDTGTAADCVRQIERLRRRVRRIVWLNPMLGRESYQPVTRTMEAVLPKVDLFASAHSLDALAALETAFHGV